VETGYPYPTGRDTQRPNESIPSSAAAVPTAAPADTASRLLLPQGIKTPISVSDAIDPASCPAATREPSVRAEAHEVLISRRAEAAVTFILVTTSKNRLNLEEQRVVLRGTLTADTFTIQMQEESNPSIPQPSDAIG
jgi:hypothetical protein